MSDKLKGNDSLGSVKTSLGALLEETFPATYVFLPDEDLRSLVESVNLSLGIPFPAFAEWGPISGKTPPYPWLSSSHPQRS